MQVFEQNKTIEPLSKGTLTTFFKKKLNCAGDPHSNLFQKQKKNTFTEILKKGVKELHNRFEPL